MSVIHTNESQRLLTLNSYKANNNAETEPKPFIFKCKLSESQN